MRLILHLLDGSDVQVDTIVYGGKNVLNFWCETFVVYKILYITQNDSSVSPICFSTTNSRS